MTTVKLEGFKELERELEKIASLASRKSVGRRVLKSAGEPLARDMRRGAPKDEYELLESIDVSTKLSGRQKALHKKWGTRSAVEMFVGAGPLPQAHNQEFGNINMPAQPFARPAWDSNQRTMLERIKMDLWDEISKAVARANRRAAPRAGA